MLKEVLDELHCREFDFARILGEFISLIFVKYSQYRR